MNSPSPASSTSHRPTIRRDGPPDGSRWKESITWQEATESGPVYGYLILIATHDGHVHVLDLRFAPGEHPLDKDFPERGGVSSEETWKRTRDAFSLHKAKWWAYLPYSPPVNVEAMPWTWDDHEQKTPSLPVANDPPPDSFIRHYNLPHEFLNP